MLWRLSRRLLSQDVGQEFDRILRINRSFLDQIAVELVEEMPDELRGLQKEVEGEPEQVADGDKETSGDDGEPDKSLNEEDNNEADHSRDEQEVETSETSPGCSSNNTTHDDSESEETSTTEDEVRSRDLDENED